MKNAILSFFTVIVFSSISCKSNLVSRIRFTAKYERPEIDHPYESIPNGWICFPRKIYPVLVGRVPEQYGPINLNKPKFNESDNFIVGSLAAFAQSLIKEEFGISNCPTIVVLLFPLMEVQPCILKTVLAVEMGIAMGVPTIKGNIHPSHARSFLFMVTHELTELLLAYPPLGAGCALYSDPRNRWIVDGIANLMATRAVIIAKKRNLLDYSLDNLGNFDEVSSQGLRSIRIAGWLQHGIGDEGDKLTETLRYAAAEYLCHLWYETARKHGREKPLREFVDFARDFSWEGPSHEDLLRWMHSTTGLDFSGLAEDVSLKEVRAYFESAKENLE